MIENQNSTRTGNLHDANINISPACAKWYSGNCTVYMLLHLLEW